MPRLPRRFDSAVIRLAVSLLLSSAAALAAAQSITEYAVPTAPPTDLYSMCLGPDGAVWFGEARTSKVGRINSDGTITEYSTVGPPYQMTAGPDGNIWIASGGIGRLTLDGQFTDFPVPPADNGYYDILDVTAGPDGAVWFADYDGERIGRISPSGGFTFVSIPEEPYAITLGPDGNLWYAARDAEVIGRVTPAGVVTRFPVPGSAPVELTAGPDGGVWFGGSDIGRISMAGAVTKFGEGQANAFRLAPGRDGNVWFTDITSINRITPAGELTRFETGSNAVYDLVYGLDGRIWFTDNANNQIGRLTLPGEREPVERPRRRGRAPVVLSRP